MKVLSIKLALQRQNFDKTKEEFPGGITKKGKKDYVVITDPLQEVLDQLEKVKERPGFEQYKFVPWLFPSVRADKKRLLEPGYQQEDYTRTKDNKTCWNAVKEMASFESSDELRQQPKRVHKQRT